MLALILSAVGLVAVTVAIHAFGTTSWIRYLTYRFVGPDGHFKARKQLPAVTWTAITLLLLHLIEVMVWALAYLLLVPVHPLDSFEKATYFSFVTFTTLGYGDITLAEHEWRLLSGVEALDGILLVGWSTALLFMVVQKSWQTAGHVHGGG